MIDKIQECAPGARCLSLDSDGYKRPHFNSLAALDKNHGDKSGDPDTVSAIDLEMAMNAVINDAINKKIAGSEFFKNDAETSLIEAQYIYNYFEKG